MDSLKDIKVIRTNDYLVIMDKDMNDIIDRSEQHGRNQIISHHYKGLQFVAMPAGDVYVNFQDLQNNQHYIK